MSDWANKQASSQAGGRATFSGARASSDVLAGPDRKALHPGGDISCGCCVYEGEGKWWSGEVLCGRLRLWPF